MNPNPNDDNILSNSLNPLILFEEDDNINIEIPSNLKNYFYEYSDNYTLDYDKKGNFIGLTKDKEKNIDEDSLNLEYEISSETSQTTSSREENDVSKEVVPEKKERKHRERVYAHKISKSWVPVEYEPKLELKFEPDTFQHQSFYFLSKNESILVTAHTSSGKTTIVDYAIKIARLHKTKVIYTSPIKALSNQKYNDFKPYNPGIITGDVSLNAESDVLIMTTEVLRNFLYSRNSIIHNVEFVIFDEVHYINNKERGVIWEECIILLPKYVTIAMLSACIPNAFEFAAWVGRIRENTIYVVETDRRVVPLEYFLCEDESIKCIKKEGSNREENSKQTKAVKSVQKNIAGNRRKDNLLYLANYVTKSNLIPAIFFCFSKRKCHDYCRRIIRPFLRENEKREVLNIITTRFNAKLSLSEQNLPQIVEIKEMLVNGVGVHHSGLLPILKELVEILFSLNLIKILFATETFSMGVNFPAKSVVFVSLKKMDDKCLRILTPGEFMQMSGRAGRRGIDKKGVVIVNYENEKFTENIEFIINNLIKSSTYLLSRFKLTYNMILQLIRSKVKAEEIIRKSFCEENVQKNLPKEIANLVKLEFIYKEKIANNTNIENKIKDLTLDARVTVCNICTDIFDYINAIREFYKNNNPLVCDYIKEVDIKQDFTFIMNDHMEIDYKRFDMNQVIRPDILLGGVNLTETYKEYVRCGSKDDKKYDIEDILYIKKHNIPFFEYKFEDYQKIVKELQIREKFKELENYACKRCPLFNKHYEEALELTVLQNKISQIKQLFDDKSLNLFEDYFDKLQFLKRYEYIDDQNNILIKGRIACEIRTVDEIVITEILFHNSFEEFDFAEIMSFICGLIVKEESERNSSDKINWIITNINEIYPFKFFNGYCDSIYDWCNGKTLTEIVNNHHISEGVFVRTVLRLSEFCRELLSACILVNELKLYEKIESGSKILKRDIIHCHSMYFDE